MCRQVQTLIQFYACDRIMHLHVRKSGVERGHGRYHNINDSICNRIRTETEKPLTDENELCCSYTFDGLLARNDWQTWKDASSCSSVCGARCAMLTISTRTSSFSLVPVTQCLCPHSNCQNSMAKCRKHAIRGVLMLKEKCGWGQQKKTFRNPSGTFWTRKVDQYTGRRKKHVLRMCLANARFT